MSLKILEEFPDWLEWLNINLQRQCDALELKNILIQNGFSHQSIEANIALTLENLSLHDKKRAKNKDFLSLSKPRFTQTNYSCRVHQVVNTKLQLYLIYDFLSSSECDDLIKISRGLLNPSTLTIPSNDKNFRTSQTAHLSMPDNPVVSAIDNKICHCLGIDKSYAETTQIQRYEIGQQFKQHTDFFEPNSKEFQRFGKQGGNRTWTFMVYLNTVKQGGETQFSIINQNIIPQQGLAVVWNNRYPNGEVNYDARHAGLPVEDGEKLIITKWFRENKITTH